MVKRSRAGFPDQTGQVEEIRVLGCVGSLFIQARCEGWLGQRKGVWIGCQFTASRADRFLYAAGAGWLMQLRLSVLSLVPGIWEAPSVRDFAHRRGRGGGGSSWQPATCAVIGPWDLGGSSIRDFLAGGRGGAANHGPRGPTLQWDLLVTRIQFEALIISIICNSAFCYIF